MTNLPPLLSSREIKEGIASLRTAQAEIVDDIQSLDAAISLLPRGQDKRNLQEAQSELKRFSGFFPDAQPSRALREHWSCKQWTEKAIALNEVARKWKAAGRLEEAKKALEEARSAEQSARRQRARS